MKKTRLRALVYADIFDYPLTPKELERWAIAGKEETKPGVKTSQKELVGKKGGFYFLKGREKTIELRAQREVWSREKLAIASGVAQKLAWIPGLKMIGLTGALAMNNAKEDDDIDFLIIAAQDTLWLVRLVIFLACLVLGIKRRRPGDRGARDKICLNLFLDESDLKIETESLFLAHEVCQLKPLINKDKTYERFIKENEWVKKYLPNAVGVNNGAMKQWGRRSFAASRLQGFVFIINRIAFVIQRQYMQPKMTTEKISLTQAFFHPQDVGQVVEQKYWRRMVAEATSLGNK